MSNNKTVNFNKGNVKKKKNSYTSLIITISALATIIIALVVFMIYSGMDKNDDNTITNNTNEPSVAQDEDLLIPITDTEPTNVKVEMEDGQVFTICVYPEVAPQSAQNFLNLVRSGFYNGLTFHRVIEGFMAQGGDPEGTGFGGSDQNIVGEFEANGYTNTLSHKRGVVSMARSEAYNSASSQFFICYDDACASLDGMYAAFGEVVEGMEVVDSFLSAGTDANDRPLKEEKIAAMTVEE